GRVPVHAHHGAERLEPERVAQAREQPGWAVLDEHVLADGGAERGHPLREPAGHASAVERKVGRAGALHRNDCGTGNAKLETEIRGQGPGARETGNWKRETKRNAWRTGMWFARHPADPATVFDGTAAD